MSGSGSSCFVLAVPFCQPAQHAFHRERRRRLRKLLGRLDSKWGISHRLPERLLQPHPRQGRRGGNGVIDAGRQQAQNGRQNSARAKAICNLYNVTTSQEALTRLVEGLTDRAGNLASGSVYPDQLAPIIRNGEGGRELVKARWGMPSPPSVLRTARDPGVTNVRNLGSPHWRRWLGQGHRCLVPVTSFSEPRGKGKGVQWFAPADAETTMFFAGIEIRGWNSLRKVKDGETVDDLYAFLTCPPNAEVAPIHPKAMPVILTRSQDWRAWLDGIRAEELQRPLPDGALRLVGFPV